MKKISEVLINKNISFLSFGSGYLVTLNSMFNDAQNLYIRLLYTLIVLDDNISAMNSIELDYHFLQCFFSWGGQYRL